MCGRLRAAACVVAVCAERAAGPSAELCLAAARYCAWPYAASAPAADSAGHRKCSAVLAGGGARRRVQHGCDSSPPRNPRGKGEEERAAAPCSVGARVAGFSLDHHSRGGVRHVCEPALCHALPAQLVRVRRHARRRPPLTDGSTEPPPSASSAARTPARRPTPRAPSMHARTWARRQPGLVGCASAVVIQRIKRPIITDRSLR